MTASPAKRANLKKLAVAGGILVVATTVLTLLWLGSVALSTVWTCGGNAEIALFEPAGDAPCTAAGAATLFAFIPGVLVFALIGLTIAVHWLRAQHR